MNNQLKRQNEAVSRLGEQLEQSQKKEASLQVRDRQICTVHNARSAQCTVYSAQCTVHTPPLGWSEGEQEEVHRPGGEAEGRYHDGQDKVNLIFSSSSY